MTLSMEGLFKTTNKEAAASVNQHKRVKAMEVPSECRLRSTNQLYLVFIHQEGQSLPQEVTRGGDISKD